MSNRTDLRKWEGWNFDGYEGTAEQLIATGLIRNDQLPGQPDRPKTTTYFAPDGEPIPYSSSLRNEPRAVHIRKTSTRRFLAYINVSAEEVERRAGLTRDRRKAEGEADRARRSLEKMPQSVKAFRTELLRQMRGMVGVCLTMAAEPEFHGYSLDSEALEEIHASFDAVVEAVVAAKINFDPARHAAVQQGYRATIAKADIGFQAKVSELTRPDRAILQEGAQ